MVKSQLRSMPIEAVIGLPVLGVLAALAALQAASASTDARSALLSRNLQTVRVAVTQYARDHSGKLPDGKLLTEQLCGRTDISGKPMPAGADISDFQFGPYLNTFPANPYVNNPVITRTIKTGFGPSPDDETSGWFYDQSTGTVHANAGGCSGR